MIADMVRIAAVGVITVLLVVLLKSHKPEFAIPVTLIGCILMVGMMVVYLKTILSSFAAIYEKTSLSGEDVLTLVKITGVAYLTDFAAGICRDAGETSVAAKVELAGRCGIVFLSLPIAVTLLQTISTLFT